MDYSDGRTKYRRKPDGFSLAMESVATNDTNVRQLIEVLGIVPQNQCRFALQPAPNVLEILEQQQ
jgi:hypothetical protein